MHQAQDPCRHWSCTKGRAQSSSPTPPRLVPLFKHISARRKPAGSLLLPPLGPSKEHPSGTDSNSPLKNNSSSPLPLRLLPPAQQIPLDQPNTEQSLNVGQSSMGPRSNHTENQDAHRLRRHHLPKKGHYGSTCRLSGCFTAQPYLIFLSHA